MARKLTTFQKHLDARDLNINKYAERLDVTASYLYEMNSGKQPPSYELAFRIEEDTRGAIPMNYWAKRPDLKDEGGPEWRKKT